MKHVHSFHQAFAAEALMEKTPPLVKMEGCHRGCTGKSWSVPYILAGVPDCTSAWLMSTTTRARSNLLGIRNLSTRFVFVGYICSRVIAFGDDLVLGRLNISIRLESSRLRLL